LNELALFAGAGGGLLGTHLLGFRPVCAVEYNAYARSILLARQNDRVLPPFPIWDDIRTFDGRRFRGIVDLLSGGFPCQAYSTAAAGKNNADDLWPEMRRIVAVVAPRLVFAENVSAKAIDAAADDLEEMGYQTRCISLGAADLGADHVRERHWLLAHADDEGELLRGIHAKVAGGAGFQASVWQTYPDEPRVADGLAHRMERYIATGNGQVPAVAAAAFDLLASRFA
jgi:DNA (cytosine-5)-methyltransferase 1